MIYLTNNVSKLLSIWKKNLFSILYYFVKFQIKDINVKNKATIILWYYLGDNADKQGSREHFLTMAEDTEILKRKDRLIWISLIKISARPPKIVDKW